MKTEYIILHYKGETLIGKSWYSDATGIFVQDVLVLKETYTPVSMVPIVMFAKFIPYSKKWGFLFKQSDVHFVQTNGDIQESFILFYEWCLEKIKKEHENALNEILIDHMKEKGVDFDSILSSDDKYLSDKFKDSLEKSSDTSTASLYDFKKFMKKVSDPYNDPSDEEPENFH